MKNKKSIGVCAPVDFLRFMLIQAICLYRFGGPKSPGRSGLIVAVSGVVLCLCAVVVGNIFGAVSCGLLIEECG